jgi:hypothetical protein
MTTETLEPTTAVLPIDPFAAAFAEAEPDAEVTTKELVIVNWSGELDRIWPTLILASTAAATACASPATTGCSGCCRSCSAPASTTCACRR